MSSFPTALEAEYQRWKSQDDIAQVQKSSEPEDLNTRLKRAFAPKGGGASRLSEEETAALTTELFDTAEPLPNKQRLIAGTLKKTREGRLAYLEHEFGKGNVLEISEDNFVITREKGKAPFVLEDEPGTWLSKRGLKELGKDILEADATIAKAVVPAVAAAPLAAAAAGAGTAVAGPGVGIVAGAAVEGGASALGDVAEQVVSSQFPGEDFPSENELEETDKRVKSAATAGALGAGGALALPFAKWLYKGLRPGTGALAKKAILNQKAMSEGVEQTGEQLAKARYSTGQAGTIAEATGTAEAIQREKTLRQLYPEEFMGYDEKQFVEGTKKATALLDKIGPSTDPETLGRKVSAVLQRDLKPKVDQFMAIRKSYKALNEIVKTGKRDGVAVEPAELAEARKLLKQARPQIKALRAEIEEEANSVLAQVVKKNAKTGGALHKLDPTRMKTPHKVAEYIASGDVAPTDVTKVIKTAKALDKETGTALQRRSIEELLYPARLAGSKVEKQAGAVWDLSKLANVLLDEKKAATLKALTPKGAEPIFEDLAKRAQQYSATKAAVTKMKADSANSILPWFVRRGLIQLKNPRSLAKIWTDPEASAAWLGLIKVPPKAQEFVKGGSIGRLVDTINRSVQEDDTETEE